METGLYPYYGPDGVRYLPTGEDYSIGGPLGGKRGKLRKNALWVEAGRLPGNRGREDVDALVSFIEGHAGANIKCDDVVNKAPKTRRTKETSSGAKSPTASSASSDSGDGGSLQHHSTLTSSRESGASWPSTGSPKPPQIVSASSSGLTSDADEPDDTEAFRQPSPAPPVDNSPATIPAAPASRSRHETATESDENDAADEEDELFTPVRPKTSRRAKQWLQPPSVASTRRSPASRFTDSQRRSDPPRYAKQTSYPTDAAYAKTAAPSRLARPTPLHSVSGSSVNPSAPVASSTAPSVQPSAKPAWNVVATQRSNTAVRPEPSMRTAAPPTSNRWASSGKPTAVVAPGQGLPPAPEHKASTDDSPTEKISCDDVRLRELRSFVESAFCALLERQQTDEPPRVLHYHVGTCWKPVARIQHVNGTPDRTSTAHLLEHDVVKAAA